MGKQNTDGAATNAEERRRNFREEKQRRRRWLAIARRDGRIPRGRGLDHSIRVYPLPAPERRKDVLSAKRATQTTLEDLFRVLTRTAVVSVEQEGMPGEFRVRAGDCGGFLVAIITRARAHWLLSIGSVLGFWAAAACHGLPYWCDNAPVVLLSRTHATRDARSWVAERTPRKPVFRKLVENTLTVRPDPGFPDLEVVTAEIAAGQCLHSVMNGTHRWDVPPVPGLSDREVRAVQFIDAFYQCTYLTAGDIRRGSRNYVDTIAVERLLALADLGAQSPRETLLRLYARDVLPGRFTWTSQVTVLLDPEGRPWKHLIADLACPELKIALFYDGSYHRAEERRSLDFAQFHRMQALGWECVRVGASLMADVRQMMEDIGDAVDRAVRRTDGG
ncbi:MAG: hypothetical protein ACTIL2_12215 [Corynebacterium sp.]|uniref:hypothetical protein n=1 Tax=Corynebacterium sp. TaxID=1720 RepID=UPI003F9DD68D